MSLKVWLPLNGDLHNQGLSDVTVINNGATVNSAGKIGSCYSFDGNDDYISLTSSALYDIIKGGAVPFSIAMWVYHADATRGILFGDYNLSGTIYFNVELTTSHTVRFYWGASPDKTAFALNQAEWTHIAIVYNGSSIQFYKNGILQTSNTYTGTLTTLTKTSGAYYLGRDSRTGTTAFNGRLNDFRVYDHALSAKEVKEIAKGLVLHYKLDTNLNVLNNCYNYPTFNTTSSNGGWSHWGPSGHAGTYSQNTDKQYIYNKANTYSHCVDNTTSATGKYYICYQSPEFAGGYRSLQFIVKEVNGLPITETICCPSWNARNGGAPANKWTRIINLGDGFYLCQVDGLSQDGSNDLVSILIQPGYKIYISEGYLENNREICSDIFNQNNLSIVYDSSGYGNNGTIIGSLETTAPSARYNYTTKFNGTSYIYTTSPCVEVKTVSLWVKWDTIPSGQSVVFLDAKSHIGLGLMSTGILCITSGLGSGNTFSKANLVANTWYHFVVVNPGGTTDIPRKLYINGIEQTATSSTSNWTYSIDQTQIGKRSTTSDGFIGSLNDVRLYSSVLTLEQIKELYNNPLNIDKNSNIYSLEYNDYEGTSSITKTGIMTNALVEPFKILPDGSKWQLLLYHYVDNGNNLFTSSNATFCNDFGLYSRLAWVDDFTYDDKYEFYVIQDGTEFRWTQTSAPTSTSITGLTTVSGYANPVNGLARSSTTNTYIGYNSWWGACGCYKSYTLSGVTGIPGFGSHSAAGICTRYLALYARVDDIHAFVRNNDLSGNNLIEK